MNTLRGARRRPAPLAALAVLAVLGAAFAMSMVAVATDPYELVVAKVGSSEISGGELNRRMGRMPPFQLRAFGGSPEEMRRGFLEQVLIRELLFTEGGAREGYGERPEIRDRKNRILRGALLSEIRREALERAPITEAEVRAYYDENREKFNAPERIAIWRILVDSRSEAEALLAELKKDLTPARWSDVAREKSLDQATSMRGGNLGFVAPDGSTSTAGVRVDPALYEAVSKVGDVELVPEPVREGERFAVVWRRQTMRAVTRSLEQEEPSIRQVLSQKRAEKAVTELVAELRKQHVTEHSPEVVDQLDMTDFGELKRAGRPGVLPKTRERVPGAKPEPGPGGLR